MKPIQMMDIGIGSDTPWMWDPPNRRRAYLRGMVSIHIPTPSGAQLTTNSNGSGIVMKA
jgi:hypothetical protein